MIRTMLRLSTTRRGLTRPPSGWQDRRRLGRGAGRRAPSPGGDGLATPRQHYFRVADSILREPWPRDVKLTLVMLAAWLNQRAIRDGLYGDDACRAVLNQAALHEITGRNQLAHARRAMRALGAHVSCSIRERGAYTEIHWPKFADFQGLTSRGRAKLRPSKTLSASASASASSSSPRRSSPLSHNASLVEEHGSATRASPRGNRQGKGAIHLEPIPARPLDDPEPPERPRRSEHVPEALARAWRLGLEAARQYGKTARWSLRGKRLDRAKAIWSKSGSHGDQVFAHIVHGFFARWRVVRPDWDPVTHLTAETITQLEGDHSKGVDRYLEAYDDAIGRGEVAPFIPKTKHELEREDEQRRNREVVEAAGAEFDRRFGR